jgi:hypothetical protein
MGNTFLVLFILLAAVGGRGARPATLKCLQTDWKNRFDETPMCRAVILCGTSALRGATARRLLDAGWIAVTPIAQPSCSANGKNTSIWQPHADAMALAKLTQFTAGA